MRRLIPILCWYLLSCVKPPIVQAPLVIVIPEQQVTDWSYDVSEPDPDAAIVEAPKEAPDAAVEEPWGFYLFPSLSP